MTCQFCGQPDGELHVCASGTYATVKMSRDLYRIFKERMELIGLATGDLDIGAEPTKGQLVLWLEVALTLLDTSAAEMRRWIDSGQRVKG